MPFMQTCLPIKEMPKHINDAWIQAQPPVIMLTHTSRVKRSHSPLYLLLSPRLSTAMNPSQALSQQYRGVLSGIHPRPETGGRKNVLRGSTQKRRRWDVPGCTIQERGQRKVRALDLRRLIFARPICAAASASAAAGRCHIMLTLTAEC